MILSKFGQLYLVASCILKDLDPQYSVFCEGNARQAGMAPREEFVYNSE